MKQAITKHTVFEHFAGRITPLQRQTLEEWLQHPANQQQYYSWLTEWEWLNLQYEVDEREALERTLRIIDEGAPADLPGDLPVLSPIRSRPFWQQRWVVAASIALIVALGMYVSRPYWYYKTIETAYGEMRRLSLPDGSLVTLNANSKLRYPRFGFESSIRQVSLTGEGYFSVRHLSTNQRFEVQTEDGLRVLVLGTEFNLYARASKTRVTLRRGKVCLVEVVNNKPRSLMMEPGDLVTRDERGHWAQQRTARPELESAWQQQYFTFDRTALTDVARLIEETYGLKLALTDSALASRTVSGSFRAESATEFLSMISQLLDVNYRQEDRIITFIE
jgi:ferric-dicitrate binding protein FerR (iron transport regulator)